MRNLGYYNGKYDLIENMTVPMNDRASYFGDGVYDVTYTKNYNIYCLDEHIDRFYVSAEKLRIKVPMEKDELKALLCELVRKLDSDEQIVYWQVTRGTAERLHSFPNCPANLWVMLRPCPVKSLDQRLTAITVEDTRFLHCDIKTLNLIPNVMAEQRAHDAGCYTAIFYRGEFVTESVHANIQILTGGKIIAHPTDNLILPGVGRANLLRIAELIGVPFEIRPFTVDEMMDADEVILTSSGSFCIPFGQIDGKAVGGRDTTTLHRLQEALVKDYLDATK